MAREKQRRRWIGPVVIGIGMGLAALTTAYFSTKTPEPQRARPPVQRQEPRGIQLELIVSDAPGKFKGIGVRFDRAHQELFAQYAPVWYEIPEMRVKVQLYFEQGMTGFTATLPQPENLNGKTLVIYGIDPSTKQRKILYQTTIRYQ